MSHLDMDGPPRRGNRNTAVSFDVAAPVDRQLADDSAAASATKTPKIQITCQFHDGEAMVYDLKAGPRRIEIRVLPSPTTESWSLAMSIKTADTAQSKSAEGSTRREALSVIEQSFAGALTTEEWAGLRAALAEVRALERP